MKANIYKIGDIVKIKFPACEPFPGGNGLVVDTCNEGASWYEVAPERADGKGWKTKTVQLEESDIECKVG